VALPNSGLGMLQSGIRALVSTLSLHGPISRVHRIEIADYARKLFDRMPERARLQFFDKIIIVKLGGISWEN
jgi:hypothetical protein